MPLRENYGGRKFKLLGLPSVSGLVMAPPLFCDERPWACCLCTGKGRSPQMLQKGITGSQIRHHTCLHTDVYHLGPSRVLRRAALGLRYEMGVGYPKASATPRARNKFTKFSAALRRSFLQVSCHVIVATDKGT